MHRIASLILLGVSFWGARTLQAQNGIAGGEVHGNFQVDAQYYIPDTAIGADTIPEKMLMNSFANLIYTKGDFSAGMRFESYHNALLGFDTRFRGNGIPYRFANYKAGNLEVTLGNYYEQFGNGLIFRSYEERGLGLDNAMDGIRVKYKVKDGLNLTGIVGKQRLYFDKGEGIVRGFDAELNLNDFFKGLEEKKTRITLGGSFVSKYQAEPNGSQLTLPENVGASAGRINLIRGKVRFIGEYAYKINDPSADNGFIYKPGEAILLMSSYSQKGFSLSLNAKHIDNMSFRSDRTAGINDLLINYSPALCMQHTYLLAAFYPYASQPVGEVAYQGELAYKFKKGSFLGGKYGTMFRLNVASANSIDTTQVSDMETTRKGYKTSYFASGGNVYFRDVVVEVQKKFSKKLKATFMYSHQEFNIDVVQGKDNAPNVISEIIIADITYKLTSHKALRLELQNLSTKQDMGDWAAALLEATLGTHWYAAVVDQYNYGNKLEYKQLHYFSVSGGYIKEANRISLSYGKQRAGVFCVGGVCRTIPASNGFTVSITSSF